MRDFFSAQLGQEVGGDGLWRESHTFQNVFTGVVFEEFIGQSEFVHRGVDSCGTQILTNSCAHSTDFIEKP